MLSKLLTTRQQNSKTLNHFTGYEIVNVNLSLTLNKICSLGRRSLIEMLCDNNQHFLQVGKLEVEEAVFRKLKMDTNLIDIPDGCKVTLQIIWTPAPVSTSRSHLNYNQFHSQQPALNHTLAWTSKPSKYWSRNNFDHMLICVLLEQSSLCTPILSFSHLKLLWE